MIKKNVMNLRQKKRGVRSVSIAVNLYLILAAGHKPVIFYPCGVSIDLNNQSDRKI
jgi:hypothetical protein